MCGVTARSLHDALLHVLTDGSKRERLLGGDPSLSDVVGADEAKTLRRADTKRLRGLARFMARHFYRERIVRLYRGSRALSLLKGRDPLGVLDTAQADPVLDAAVLGSPATADVVAALVETDLVEPLADRPWGSAVVCYEGATFRVAAGPRARRIDVAGQPRELDGRVPVRSPQARIVTLDWNVLPLLATLRIATTPLPEPAREPTPLLVAQSPQGRVTTVRCPEAVSRFLEALNGERGLEDAAATAGLEQEKARGLVAKLTEIGAVEWRVDTPRRPG